MAKLQDLTIRGGAHGFVTVSGKANLSLEDFDTLLYLLREEYKLSRRQRIEELKKSIEDLQNTIKNLKAELDKLQEQV